MADAAAASIDMAQGEVVTVSLPSGSYRTYVMRWQVSSSFTGEVLSRQDGITIHQWLQAVTAEELQAVGDQFVSRAALWAAGVRNA
jgi:hypothetical protein